MKTIVRVQRSAEYELNRWVTSMPGEPRQRRAFARIIIAALVQTLERHHGPPPGATPIRGLRPPAWWWEYDTNFWVMVCVRDQRPPLFRFWEGRTRRITVVQIRRQRQNPAGPTSLPP